MTDTVKDAIIEQQRTDIETLLEAISYYSDTSMCACKHGCECGHCKCRRLTHWALEHPGMLAVNAYRSNMKFLSEEWSRLVKENVGLRDELRKYRPVSHCIYEKP